MDFSPEIIIALGGFITGIIGAVTAALVARSAAKKSEVKKIASLLARNTRLTRRLFDEVEENKKLVIEVASLKKQIETMDKRIKQLNRKKSIQE